MFMTDDQKKYYAAMKKMGNKKPVKATPRPRVNSFLHKMMNIIIIKLRNKHTLNLLSMLMFHLIAVETTSYCLWNSDKQEIWHDHHALYRSQYAGHDSRSLSSKWDVEFCLRQSKHGVYSDILSGMHPEDICIKVVLFQGTMEYVWLCCRYTFNIR